MECLCASNVRTLELEQYLTISCKVPSGKFWLNQRSITFPRHGYLESYKPAKLIYHMHQYRRHSSLRAFAETVSLDEDPLSFSQEESASNELDSNNEELLSQKPDSDELKSLLADSERGKLLRKLSEANQYNRFLRRQSIAKDDALVNFKSELTILELELQALIGLAEELANSEPPIVSRKINGKYITSHLLSRLTAVHEKVKTHTKNIDSVKDIELFWGGMAESVQVMGSFDGWTQGEDMSPEYTGSYTRFSVTMRLRPGRYEIKFLVDGEWQLSPELPTVGEGLLRNNLLIVE